MRTLRFIVDGQSIRPDPSCDFSGIAKGTKGYLQAEFVFNDEWNDLFKVAEFRTYLDGKLKPVPIVKGKCTVPDSVTDTKKWKVRIIGKRGERMLTTNHAEVKQCE